MRAILPLTLLAAFAAPLPAHVVTRNAGSAVLVTIQEDKVAITFDLGFADMWAQAEMVSMDSDRDQVVSESEADRYMQRTWEERVAPFLELRIDGEKLELRLISTREVNLLGEISPSAFDIYYEIEAELPPKIAAPGKEHRLEFENHTLKRESPTPPTFYVPMPDGEGQSRSLSYRVLEPPQLFDALGAADLYTMMGRKLVETFEFGDPTAASGRPEAASPGAAATASPGANPPAAAEAGQGAQEPAVPPAPRPRTAPEARSREERFFNDAFSSYPRLGFWGKVGFILLAMAWGASHALSPGHGKTMVAAYLVGSRGRIRDAVLLGLSTTFSHTITVFIAGFGIHLALAAGSATSSAALNNRIVIGTSLLSGLLLLGLGLGLFFRRWSFAGDPHAMEHYFDHHHHHGPGGHHHHHHHHGPSAEDPAGQHAPDHHPAGTSGGKTGFWSLVGLGISGGLVPCPAGITLILLGLLYQRLIFSLLLLVFFSLALGTVLVAIGVLTVTGSRLLAGKMKVNRQVLSYLPALSALFIAGLGAFFTVQTFQLGRTEIAAILQSIADSLRA